MFGKHSVFIGLCLAALVVAGIVADLQGADSRHMMNLQGRLTDTAGNPTSGDHLFELRVFDDGSAGTQLYYEAQISAVNSGIYNILVGDGHVNFTGTSTSDYSVQGIAKTGGIPTTVFDREDLWLEVEVDQDNPLRPRTKIVSSAFAYRAIKADSLSGTPGGGGSAISISGSTITDAGGGAVMGRGVATATPGADPMSGTVVNISAITKTTDASRVRVIYSDNFTRGATGTLDCNWTITVGSTTVCTFGVGQRESDFSGTFTSAQGSNQTTTNVSAGSIGNTTATNQNSSPGTGGSSTGNWNTGGPSNNSTSTDGASMPDRTNQTSLVAESQLDHSDSMWNPPFWWHTAKHDHVIWGNRTANTDMDWEGGSFWTPPFWWGSGGRHHHDISWNGSTANQTDYMSIRQWAGGSGWGATGDSWGYGYHKHVINRGSNHSHNLNSHSHSASSNDHSHTVNAHSHSQDAHSHPLSTAHTHDMVHTHTTSLTIKDNWTSRVPVTRVCLGSGIAKGSYPVTVTGSGGANCRASDSSVLLVDEVF